MSERQCVFISSVQKEMADERRTLHDFIEGDALLRRFFEVFLFEDLPASDRRVDDVYLHEVGRSAVYVGLFGRDYGFEDAQGISATEREFERATALGIERLVFVKNTDEAERHPKTRAPLRQPARADGRGLCEPGSIISNASARCAPAPSTPPRARARRWQT